MVTISSGDAFLFFGAALIGLSAGVIGNLWATGAYRIFDRLEEHYNLNKDTANSILFLIISLIVAAIVWYFLNLFTAAQQLP